MKTPGDLTRRDAIKIAFGATAASWLSAQGAFALDTKRVRLFVRKVPLTVYGRATSVAIIEQGDKTMGYSPEQKEGFHVEVVNELDVPTTLHWHGLVVPDRMDGVPWVTQEPIPAGGSMAYDFPLLQSGTYWMHSHYGLQEQYLEAAPLIVWTPEQRARADRQFAVMLSDFSFTPAAEILANLEKPPAAMPDGMKMENAPMKMEGAAMKMYAQKVADGRLVRTIVDAAAPDIDVRYDALLANRRTIDSPEVLKVSPGESVLLRIIASSSATDFYIDTGALEAEVLAVDGKDVQPLSGRYFQLAIAQRIDLRVKIPAAGGAFPIVAQGEGTRLQAGVVLATPGAAIPALPKEAEMLTVALDNTQEKLLRAKDPIALRKAEKTLPVALGGTMQGYRWTINGEAYPNRNSLDVRKGDAVEMVFTNATGMGHPMHLHGHDFQVVEIDGEAVNGAMRDTIEIPPHSTIKVAFSANNPGIWALHCHIIYHLATGMFTVLKYNGADTKYWRPEESAREILSF